MAKPVNLVGNRYGYLTVIERAENNSKGNTQWLCKCDCGNEKICLGYDLTHGRTTTCGCAIYLRGKPSPKRISLVGEKCGKLTVVSLNEEKTRHGVLFWNCLCECGNKYIARGSNLKSGKSTHCGCSRKEYPNNFIDLTGRKYGSLTVLDIYSHSKGRIMWNCVCDCGQRIVANGESLRTGNRKTCGDRTRHRKTVRIRLSDTDRRLRSEWRSMLARCTPKYHSRKNYFDKGISVCEEWNDFEAFEAWALNNGYANDLTLDRINCAGNYEPDNCRWADMKTQQNNRTDNVYICLDGVTKTMRQWSEHYGIPYGTVKARRRRGWSEEKIFEPLHKNQYQ